MVNELVIVPEGEEVAAAGGADHAGFTPEEMDQMMVDTPRDESAAGDQTSSAQDGPAGWQDLSKSPKMLVVLIIGGAFIAFVLVLQIREWGRTLRR